MAPRRNSGTSQGSFQIGANQHGNRSWQGGEAPEVDLTPYADLPGHHSKVNTPCAD